MKLTPVALLIALAPVTRCDVWSDRVVVASKNFTEQTILAELVAQQIERRTDIAVDRRFFLGGTFVCHRAIVSGEVDIYVEYTGTALAAILERAPVHNADSVYTTVRTEYEQRFALIWGEPLGFNNTFAILVRGDDARRLGLQTISQAAPHTPGWRAGFGYEFMEREDGFSGLAESYGLRFADTPRTMDLGLTYRALADGQVDLIAGNSTDGLIEALDLVQLRDDRSYFPPYHAAPIVRADVLERHPEIGTALDELSGLMSDDQMRRLNYLVDVE
nr:ABC transporter substrate-binding protein [Gemmatimonadota bacterium]NIO31119.1 ABC transporter substrate-binding protein [Gemmatimonadota bacterium]